jgi:hypothetical protein
MKSELVFTSVVFVARIVEIGDGIPQSCRLNSFSRTVFLLFKDFCSLPAGSEDGWAAGGREPIPGQVTATSSRPIVVARQL